MNKKDQRKFLKGLAREVVADLLSRSSKWPSEWDGHELRALLQDRFAIANMGKCKDDGSEREPDEKVRRRAYQNECITRNLL